jgi:2,3-bisphosphoglycerate-independent phosphoglycerate mutase
MELVMSSKQVLLCILDGWGLAADQKYSAIAKAKIPFWKTLERDYPNTSLKASGLAVGLPTGQMGNSEVGHTTIGAGRVMFQDLPRISNIFTAGDSIAVLEQTAEKVKKTRGAVHLLGLLSDGGVHSHIDHLVGTARLFAAKGIKTWVHGFLDGRDTPQKSALLYLDSFSKAVANMPLIQLATLGGRYYAMDRDKNWDRIAKAYEAIVESGNDKRSKAVVEESYAMGVTDEFIKPTALAGYMGMQDGDAFVFCNFRADRARQLSQALGDKDFNLFQRQRVINFSAQVQFTEYSVDHSKYLTTVFPAEKISSSLGEVISKSGLRQFRIAETEKYAHVTFFFNGGVEEKFMGEDRVLVKSPAVATYDLQPEMSSEEVTGKLLEAIDSQKYNFLVVNFANPDMVGHTGNMDAAIKAVEVIDLQLQRLVEAMQKVKGTIFITADHGNVEKMFDEEKQQPHTAHTTNDVPFVVVKNGPARLRPEGTLADVAPTVLQEMDITIPAVFTGKSLLY